MAAYNDYLHGNIGITSESVTLKDFIESWMKNVVSLKVGLTWDEIDFAMKRINLSRQILYYSKGGYHFSTLMTKTSKRYIIIDSELIGGLSR